MKIATFNNETEANKFIEGVVLAEQSPIQYADGTIVVFYEATQEEYQRHFVEKMIRSLENNLFHEEVRKAAIDAELEARTKHGTHKKEYQEAEKRQKDAKENIDLFESKLNAMKAWKAASTSNKSS